MDRTYTSDPALLAAIHGYAKHAFRYTPAQHRENGHWFGCTIIAVDGDNVTIEIANGDQSVLCASDVRVAIS